ncbi:MAG: efflux RND transporter periplasmic adaptor subunit [Desulfobacula sp.]|nr:efflux RND transporter periplasmic adaptor subunit [Desulfobacula sp.]
MKKIILFILFLPTLVFSCRNDNISPGFTSADDELVKTPQHIVEVEQKNISQMYEAVGTIRPLTESVIESQVSAKVVSVSFVPGKAVKKGQVLIQLDARRLNTRLKQAKEGLSVARNNLKQTNKSMDEAKAGRDQARAAYKRTKKLFAADIVPSQKLEIDKSIFLQAKARFEKSQEAELSAKASIRQAQQIVQEADIAFGYSKITSPADGIVAKRMIDPGDLAVPGKPLMVIQTSGALRLEANVREGLINKIRLGQTYQVKIEILRKMISTTIQEIVPYADPTTRTFLVKASLPRTPGVYPGMFGRLLIPVEKEQTLLIPTKAVRRVGQLELILVKQKGTWQSVYIKTGKQFDNKIEVLAGLTGNETIGYNE